MNKILIWSTIIIVAIIAVVFLLPSYMKAPEPEEEGAPTLQVPAPGFEDVEEMVVVEEGQNVVTITSTGFEPSTITIKKGESVTWINESGRDAWPASAIHPTHALYPVGGGCIGSAFDACRGLKTGETYTFKFDETGSWKYHNHLNPSMTGTVVTQ